MSRPSRPFQVTFDARDPWALSPSATGSSRWERYGYAATSPLRR